MKPSILKTGYILIFLCTIGIRCKNDQIVEDTDPGLSVYKTRNDYFNSVHSQLKDGKVVYVPDILQKVEIDNSGKVKYKFRFKLVNGYILGCEEYVTTAYLNYSFEEYYNIRKLGILPSLNDIQSAIIDDDPFVEFYYDDDRPRIFELKDTMLINEIIKNGEIEKYFKRLK